MRTAGIRELKAKLSEYLGHVKDGEVVLVTERGHVIAEITRPGQSAAPVTATDADLARLQGLLTVTRSGVNDPEAYPRTGVQAAPGTAERLLDEERGP
jgi:antitoxin (DNA-binding transcriptional repressor) of toxin-antitoxin stability system